MRLVSLMVSLLIVLGLSTPAWADARHPAQPTASRKYPSPDGSSSGQIGGRLSLVTFQRQCPLHLDRQGRAGKT